MVTKGSELLWREGDFFKLDLGDEAFAGPPAAPAGAVRSSPAGRPHLEVPLQRVAPLTTCVLHRPLFSALAKLERETGIF